MSAQPELIYLGDGLVRLWMPCVEPGEVIGVDGHSYRRLSACIAKHRLRAIVKQDRESVPCFAWVGRPSPDEVACKGYAAIGAVYAPGIIDFRPRCRWVRVR